MGDRMKGQPAAAAAVSPTDRLNAKLLHHPPSAPPTLAPTSQAK